MANSVPQATCVEAVEMAWRVRQALPSLSLPPDSLQWLGEYSLSHEALLQRLQSIPGMRWQGGLSGILGDPGDPWSVTFHVAGRAVVAVAPQGFAQGSAFCDAQSEFGAWLREFLGRHLPEPSFP